MVKFDNRFWDPKGFDELRKYCRQSNDFCKDVCGILHSRSKLEQTYAENLSQLAIKASKCGKDLTGTLKTAWTKVSAEIENEAELHKNLGARLNDDAAKELKIFIEGQNKARKPVEQAVEKSIKLYNDKRTEEQKAKRNSHLKARDYENTLEQYEEAKSGKKKTISEKDLAKLDTKCKKAASSIEKADKEYRNFNLTCERSRIGLNSAIRRFSQICETTEGERIEHIKELFINYGEMLEGVIPQLQQSYQNVKDDSSRVDSSADIDEIAEQRGSEREAAEQLLSDYYEEDFQNLMSADRRKTKLQEKIKDITSDLKREVKAREGIAHLFDVYETSPNYTNEEGQMDVADQLDAANEVVNSLEASLYKLQCALAQVNREEKPDNRLSSYVLQTRDKQGLACSVLKIPLGEVTTTQIQFTDSLGFQNDDFLDDEFDDGVDPAAQSAGLGQCVARYDYDATQADELTIRADEVINILTKHDEDWWYGELNGNTGIFPATYVEEM